MSLFSSISLANTALQAAQVGLQVAGQNIANSNTPGYIREIAEFQPGPTQRLGNLLEGTGVETVGVVQQVDQFLQSRLRGATSDSSSAQVNQQTYSQLEGLVNELSDSDVSTSLDNFFSSISDILNQPESDSVRNLAVLKGQTLTNDINSLANNANQLRSDLNDRVGQSVDDINRLLSQVAKLNVQISNADGGGQSPSDAVGLSDQRNTALTQLAQLIDVKTQIQQDGSVAVFAGGDYLVLEGNARQVEVTESVDRGMTINNLQIAQINAKLNFTSGQVAGLINSRDNVLGTFLDKLNGLAGSLAFEFNRVYSSGQGLKGYQSLTSQAAVDDPDAALSQAGLAFSPQNGQFDVQVYNADTGLTETSIVHVDLNGLDHDTTLNDLAAQLNGISGVSASINSQRQLTIQSTSSNLQISFANDTSGALASLGINTFFTGTDAFSLGINQAVANDPATFATSAGGIGADTNVAVSLAQFQDQPLTTQNSTTLSQLYDRLTSDVSQGSAVAQNAADSAQTFESSLNAQNLSISGVSIDDETVNMIQYQRSFQATAKYIATLNDLLNTLINL
ncbi:MAG TPA: flagellar hook-associated protein FlgK [Pirellulales bacterium]|jgi:flagellar hook-associated protein 1 FlgK